VFLRSRHVSRETAVRYRLGYADPSIEVPECFPDFVPFATKHWLRRVVFPLHATTGGVIGFQTRKLDEKVYRPYYGFDPDLHPPVFGLPQALPAIWETGHAVIAEGVFDTLALAQHTPVALGVMTAKVPNSVCKFLHRYVDRLTVLLDMDEPGRLGAQRLLDLRVCPVMAAPLYNAHDPDDLCRIATPDQLARVLRKPGI
jgi:DNA primase